MARVNVPITDLTPVKASLTTACAGAQNDLVFTAKTGGPGGNNIRVAYIVAGASTPLTIVVEGYDITVNVATDGASAAASTSAQIKAALEASTDATALITVAHAAANDGTGIVAAFAMTALAAGSFANTQPALTNGDATNGHYITGNDGQVIIEVVSSDGSSRTVTLNYAPTIVPGVTVAADVITVAAGATVLLGPFPARLFNQNAAKDVYFTPSVSSTVDFRAYRVTKAA